MSEALIARAAIVAAAARFASSATPRLDAELLMAHAMGVARDALLLGRLDDPAPPGFATLVERRAAHEPVAYLTGSRGFWTIDLAVGPGALVPRADSETLVEAAIAACARSPATILDLGTGPGTLLLALLDHHPRAQGLGVDRSAAALGYAVRNARALGMAGRARFVRGDWAAALDARFDLVVCNPPYVERDAPLPDEVRAHEPASALFAGIDGMDDYRRIARVLPRLMAVGGVAAIEIGATQAPSVTALLAAEGLATVLHHDLGGRPRVLVAT